MIENRALGGAYLTGSLRQVAWLCISISVDEVQDIRIHM